MKKLIALLMAAVLVLSLMAGCSKKRGEGDHPQRRSHDHRRRTAQQQLRQLHARHHPRWQHRQQWRPGPGPARYQQRPGDRSLAPGQQRRPESGLRYGQHGRAVRQRRGIKRRKYDEKIFFALLLAAVLALSLLAGCTKSQEDAQQQTGTSSDVSMAVVVAGTFGDRSFYDSSKEGADRLAKDLGVQVKTIECNNVDHTQQIRNAADAAEIVVLVGWEFYDVETVAPEYPDVHFIWVDNATSAPVANVLNITYAQNEGSFLAGYIAAAVSETGVVGAVGGEDADTINDFIVGYTQGAQYANSSIQVETVYANTYDDPAVGKDCALTLHEKKADVVFQIASKTGDGVFEAAKEKGFYAIGVDSDQKYIADDVIICSMMKQVGNSIYEAVSDYISGDTSKWGTTWVADMATGFIGIGYGEAGATQQVPDSLKSEVEELAKKKNCLRRNSGGDHPVIPSKSCSNGISLALLQPFYVQMCRKERQ